MQADGVLVRFGEIGIKSAPVRRQMLETLRLNILAAMERQGVEGDVRALGARLWMEGPDVAKLLHVAECTFGVVSASPVRKVPATIADMGAAASAEAVAHEWTTFAIRANREGDHAFTSQEIGIQVGSMVWKAAEAVGRKPKVDLSNPDFEIHIDVRRNSAFIFTHTAEGPGGIPVGSQGVAVALLSDEASFLAAWLMMRRGCRVIGLHAGTSGSLPVEAAAELVRWGMDPDVEVLPVCTGTTTKVVLLEAAAKVAADYEAQVLVTGDGLDSAFVPAPIPVLRPVCGLDAREVDRVRRRVQLPPIESTSFLDVAAKETVDSLLSMRRTVTP